MAMGTVLKWQHSYRGYNSILSVSMDSNSPLGLLLELLLVADTFSKLSNELSLSCWFRGRSNKGMTYLPGLCNPHTQILVWCNLCTTITCSGGCCKLIESHSFYKTRAVNTLGNLKL